MKLFKQKYESIMLNSFIKQDKRYFCNNTNKKRE